MRVLFKDVNTDEMYAIEVSEVRVAKSIETINYGNGMSSSIAFEGVVVFISNSGYGREIRYIVTDSYQYATALMWRLAKEGYYDATAYAERTFVDCGVVDADEYCQFDKETLSRMMQYSRIITMPTELSPL